MFSRMISPAAPTMAAPTITDTRFRSLATLNSEGVTQMHSSEDSSLTLQSGNTHQGQSCSADVKAHSAVGHCALEAKA